MGGVLMDGGQIGGGFLFLHWIWNQVVMEYQIQTRLYSAVCHGQIRCSVAETTQSSHSL